MARAAVIPGVSASTDAPQQRATRGRGRTPTTTTAKIDEVKKVEPAKRGRKPGKTTMVTTTAAAKNKKSVTEDEEDEDDDLSFDVTTSTAATTKKNTKSAASKNTRPTRQVATKEVEDNASSSEEDDELADFEVTKKKAGRPTKAKTASTTTTSTKSTRGRPKTVTLEKQSKEQDVVTNKKPRGRRPAAKTNDDNGSKTVYVATASATSSLAKARTLEDAARKKKTVTFADLTDSDEEIPEVEEQKPAKTTGKKATAATKSSGLKAKPVRKAGTATRGRPPKSQAAAVKPLSPKKATQLAKGSSSSASSGDEDELAPKKPVYSLVVQKSPVKTQEPQHTGLSSPVKRIMLPGQTSTPARSPVRPTSHQDENTVPSLQNPQPSSAQRDLVLMGSPARRPPPSTSKETIRDTPRRGPLFISNPSASKLSSNMEENSFLQKLSPLKISPKKGGNLGVSFISSSEKGSSTPFNAKLSLLKSPAKRIQSPFVFQKVHEHKSLYKDSNVNDQDVDIEMRDDDDVFGDDGNTDRSHTAADELSDDERSMDTKAAQYDDDDVFVDHKADEQDHPKEASGIEQGNEDVEDDSPELVQNVEPAVEAGDGDLEDQLEDDEQKDVEMSQDKPSAGNDEGQGQQEVHSPENIPFSEADDHAKSDAEMEEDIPNDDEHESTPEADDVQPAEEDVQQTPVDEQNTTYENIEEHAVEIAESNEVVIHAEPEEENDNTPTEIDTSHSNAPIHSTRSSIASRDVFVVDEVDEVGSALTEGTPPAAPSPPIVSPIRHFGMSFRDQRDDMNSEYSSTPASRRQSIFSSRDSILPGADSADDTFTSLAARLKSWNASSPAKQRRNQSQKSIFSPVVPKNLTTPRRSMQGNKYSQIQSMRQSLAARHSLANSVAMDGDESDTVARQSPRGVSDPVVEAEVSQSEMGKMKPQDKPQTPVSMSITPVRVNRDEIRTVHTVSKVPLKPEAEGSPIKYPRKRTRSMSIDIQLPIRASPDRLKLVPKSRKPTPDFSSPSKRDPLSEIKSKSESEDRAAPASTTTSPVKTPRRESKAEQQCLRGAVVFVDVHTTEGEDASGIFVELLTQMGAKCVKSWSWNPRSSQSPGVDGSESINNSKVGITHVVYKDGGVRTMEKVRQAGNLVKCVGVGWVLDCERANKWIDEAHYYVDSTIIPRGGAKRRKSMQPRALANVNGSLMSSTSTSSSSTSSLSSSIGPSNNPPNRRSRQSDWEDTMQDFRRMSPTNSVNENVPKTPTNTKTQRPEDNDNDESEYKFNFNFDFSAMSPTTPGFLTQNSRLVQQTCPPKQTNQGLFSSMLLSNNHDDVGEISPSVANLRAKLEAARRKSLAFKPKFGSPLSRS
ncbi:conserved hypothetical protein [Talaromyces stipitatus ATCC 10500]|uniref:BRCT domain-containing protein n=1 Tax=Talaromyces stipitatus (strain ATCC 10500 / CBS 375.48 / QM 6759 / NRRL 1006) TaxID=441959 RepID=B8MHW8_TALSN|nr:uncharacterized protein TSTA_015360 [Talaromyces stipitatus ATCC 10500]EED16448.1 conserved hypothetical protein [Talaromyces stipitatus ATCC 10500]